MPLMSQSVALPLIRMQKIRIIANFTLESIFHKRCNKLWYVICRIWEKLLFKFLFNIVFFITKKTRNTTFSSIRLITLNLMHLFKIINTVDVSNILNLDNFSMIVFFSALRWISIQKRKRNLNELFKIPTDNHIYRLHTMPQSILRISLV